MDEQRDQLSFASLDYAVKKKTTKREVFLAEMASVVPWSKLEAVIDPFYPKMGPQGGRSVGHQRESQAGAKTLTLAPGKKQTLRQGARQGRAYVPRL